MAAAAAMTRAAGENERLLLEMLEDNDDVQNVYHNAELPEEEDDED